MRQQSPFSVAAMGFEEPIRRIRYSLEFHVSEQFYTQISILREVGAMISCSFGGEEITEQNRYP